jgi:hypothetical protein
MKRLLTFLLLSFYTLSSVGASVSTHYCMGKIRKCQCAKPREGSIDHCCKDTVKFVKSQDEHAVKWVSFETKQFPIDNHLESNNVDLKEFESFSDIRYTSFLHISWSPPPLYIMHCNYRI